MTTGIYQILNKLNGKSYIGQSRNIEKRWRQHTQGLEKSNALESGSYPLRAAFLKYGLKQFEFNIVEKCAEADLLIRENYWISQIKPEYNCNIWNPGKKKKPEKVENKFWIQYHNYNKLGYLPGEFLLDEHAKDSEIYNDLISCVSTGKRSIFNAKGDTVFLIVGIGEDPKQYYLMYRMIVEDIQIRDDAKPYQKSEIVYDAFGEGWFLNPPQLLNSSEFLDFQRYCGNFGFGFMSVGNSSYLKTLEYLSNKYRGEKNNFPQYIESLYTQVLTNNPKELSVVDKKGVARHLVFSTYPDNAIYILQGLTTKLVVFGLTDLVVGYRERLLIHTLSYYEDVDMNSCKKVAELVPQLKQGCLKILEHFELDQETFPAHAIQGWVIVENIFKYDQETFAADQDAHHQGNDLNEYMAECGFSDCDAWCIEVSHPVFFEEPIFLSAPDGVEDGDPWFPSSEVEIKAFRLALENIVIEE